MAKLTYAAMTSLDGYIEDADGKFDWGTPDPDVHAFANDLERSIGIHLFGRRMYETMAVWQTVGVEPSETPPAPEELDYAEVWRATDKIVYSRTLDAVWTPRTRLEREFDPETVRRLKDSASSDLSIGGADLAQHAFAAGLIDEVQLFVFPVAVGAGKPALPTTHRLDLHLRGERRFPNGTVYLHYEVRSSSGP